MQFYKEFSTYYDDIFQTSADKVEFLANYAEKNEAILDVATGTGNYAIALAQKNYSVRGLDLSEAMIKQAQTKIKDRELDVEFKVGDMREATAIYEQEFALIYCIGNSIVHLDNETEIENVFKKFYTLLNKSGQLILQIVNYDRILDKNITSLPTINNQEKNIKLIRNYELKNEQQINFKTKLLTPQGKFENTVPLYPLRANRLKKLAIDAGFNRVDFYGDFNYGDYSPQSSFPLVAVITK